MYDNVSEYFTHADSAFCKTAAKLSNFKIYEKCLNVSIELGFFLNFIDLAHFRFLILQLHNTKDIQLVQL